MISTFIYSIFIAFVYSLVKCYWTVRITLHRHNLDNVKNINIYSSNIRTGRVNVNTTIVPLIGHGSTQYPKYKSVYRQAMESRRYYAIRFINAVADVTVPKFAFGITYLSCRSRNKVAATGASDGDIMWWYNASPCCVTFEPRGKFEIHPLGPLLVGTFIWERGGALWCDVSSDVRQRVSR